MTVRRSDLGLVGSIVYQAERDKLPEDHPLRGVAERMNAALQAWAQKPNDPVVLAQLQTIWGSTQLAWQQYIENRYDPEPEVLKKRTRHASLPWVQE